MVDEQKSGWEVSLKRQTGIMTIYVIQLLNTDSEELRRESYNFVLGYLVIFKVCSFSKCIMSTHYSLAAVLDMSDACVLKAEMETKLLSELEQRHLLGMADSFKRNQWINGWILNMCIGEFGLKIVNRRKVS